MKVWGYHRNPHRTSRSAFTLAEIVMALGLIGTTGIALLSGLSTGFHMMRFARENLRATQIMLEKVETIRLYSWEEVTQPDFIPSSFTAYYDPNATNECKGLTYYGAMSVDLVSPEAMTSSYSNDMRKVTVQLTWQTGNTTRTRVFSSYISRYGLQNYIY
jgi:uncharacterized protein (TIGR02598 family)